MAIKFPFEPNEKVKAAFRSAVAQEEAVRLMTIALMEATTRLNMKTTPWDILRKEHPDVLVADGRMTYNNLTEKLDLKS